MAQEATRRCVLATAVALPVLAAGCKGVTALGRPPEPLPDTVVARDAITVETQLIGRYHAVMVSEPQLAGLLRPLHAQHAEHLARLRVRLLTPQPVRPPAAARLSPPAGTHASLAWLAAAETASCAWQLGHLGQVPPSFAQLLASIAASEATHAALLTAHRARR